MAGDRPSYPIILLPSKQNADDNDDDDVTKADIVTKNMMMKMIDEGVRRNVFQMKPSNQRGGGGNIRCLGRRHMP